MHKRPRTVFLLMAMVVSCSLVSQAQQTQKIGLVNSQEILEKSAEGKKAISQLEERNKKIQQDLTKLDDQIRQLESRLTTQQLTMTQEAIMSLSVDLERRRTERQRVAEDAQRDMQELTQRLFIRIQNEVMPIISKLGQEKGMDMILDLRESGVLYFSPAVDLTQEVIKRYDASKAGAK